MMPINTPRFVEASWTRNSDSLDYDLEDSVPQSEKEYARSLVRDTIPIGHKGGAAVTIRINAASPEADIAASVWPGLSAVTLPKAETGDQVRLVDQLITKYERLRGIRPGTIEIRTLIESAKGVANAEEIASASPRLKQFGGGGGYDMSLDLGVEMFVGFDQFFYGRQECTLVARALGLGYGVGAGGGDGGDTSGSVSDGERAYLNAVASRKVGGRGGGGLHPNVVEPQNRGYTPDPEEVEEAKRILAAWKEIDESGETEGAFEGRTVDKFEAARAEELIEWAEACAEYDAFKARKVAETREKEGLLEASRSS
jgi:citrate lyase subunit beta/citryl-CoA lyase